MGTSNQMLEPGNVSIASPCFITGKTGTLTARAAADPIATLVNLGRLKDTDVAASGLLNVPIYVSQIRLKYVPLTAPTTGIAFEIHKATVATQRTTGTTAKTVQAFRRKTSGYAPIPTTEINMWIAGTDATGGGSVTVLDVNSPFDFMSLGGGTAQEGSESIWRPADLCPLFVEQGEGLEVRAVQHTGTGILFVGIDFLRQ